MPALLIVLFLFILVEGTITTLPLVLFLLVLLVTKLDPKFVLGLAFASGILLDILRVRTVGQTSLLLVTFLFLIFLYGRKYEIKTLPFVSVAAFVGSLSYALVFHLPQAFLSSIVVTFFTVCGFLLFSRQRSRFSSI